MFLLRAAHRIFTATAVPVGSQQRVGTQDSSPLPALPCHFLIPKGASLCNQSGIFHLKATEAAEVTLGRASVRYKGSKDHRAITGNHAGLSVLL